jgi:type VI secretion system secreted protein Hcp
MAFDAFLVFTAGSGVAAKETQGESQDKKFGPLKAIEPLSFSFGAANAVNVGSGSGGAGAGKALLLAFNFTKSMDTASTALFHTMVHGGHYEKVELYLRKAGTKSEDEFAKVTMAMVFVSSIQLSGSQGSDVPMENVVLEYGAIEIKYRGQKKDGSLLPATDVQWSQVLNTPSLDVE